jgi:hypothetical protein
MLDSNAAFKNVPISSVDSARSRAFALWTWRNGSAHRVRGHEPSGLRVVEEPLQGAANVAGGRVEPFVLLLPDDGAHVLGGDVADRLGADGRHDRLVEVATRNREVPPFRDHHVAKEAFAELDHGGVGCRPLLREPLLDRGRLALRGQSSRLSRSARASLSDSAG